MAVAAGATFCSASEVDSLSVVARFDNSINAQSTLALLR